ncbi:glycosylphosphatidylinositol anchor biosynthesis [Polyrhizophydium stewartii]|uniref:Mannosyltransferase n=1 Tax=Polyrhizophydium stewartii TaxID=2732419 RepID=A0ABR4NL12_9FUNG
MIGADDADGGAQRGGVARGSSATRAVGDWLDVADGDGSGGSGSGSSARGADGEPLRLVARRLLVRPLSSSRTGATAGLHDGVFGPPGAAGAGSDSGNGGSGSGGDGPTPQQLLRVAAGLVVFRIANALAVRTHFDPDEFWQSLEVAHEFVFGVGYLTWEWTYRIRGFAHPLVFAGVYKALAAAGLDDTDLLGCFAAAADLYTFRLAWAMFGPSVAKWTLVATIVSWFNFFCLVRTYSNSLEACLTAAALFYWPWPRSAGEPRPTRSGFRIALALAAAACIIRPTNAILWAFLGVRLLAQRSVRRLAVVLDTIAAMIAAVCVSMSIDYVFFGTWTFAPWEFVRFNVLHNISIFYGGHPFHWYFSQGIPVVLLTLLPLCAWGIAGLGATPAGRRKRQYFWMCVWTVCVLSIQAHKEFRFLMPLVAPMMLYAGVGLHRIELADAVAGRRGWASHLRRAMAAVCVTNVIAALYLSRVHQRGVMDVMHWLRDETHQGRVDDVLFLMPCHSTPFYSHIHRNISMRMVTCEPPIGVTNRAAYRDETDVLYDDPEGFVRTYFETQLGNKTLSWPTPAPALGAFHTAAGVYMDVPGQPYRVRRYTWASHVVMFDNARLWPLVSRLMDGSDYTQCARFFNSHFHDDSKRLGDVVVWCRPVQARGRDSSSSARVESQRGAEL